MVNIYAPTASDDLSAVELELYHLIMTYRAQNGLAAIPLSKALTTTAGRHSIDTYENFWVAGKAYAPGANMHSWSDAPYFANHSNMPVMWDAPERLGTGYTSNGYEISANGYADVTAALNGWKVSSGHNGVILNQGQWANYNWTSIGIGVEQGAAGRIYHVWFGDAVDPTGVPRILGGSGVDTLTGTAFRDDLYGLGSNDVIRGGAGNDTIDGGDGTDIAVYSGAFSNYQITQTGTTFTVVDLRGGSPDGTDTLKNIETLRFSDGDRSLIVTPTAPEIAVAGNGVNIVDGDATPATTDNTFFGSMTQGGGAIQRTFTVTNTGNATLTTSGLVLPTGFTLVEGLSASIAAGGSDTFTVRMDTASAGTKSGQISFTTNDADESPFNFTIAGTVNMPPVAGDDFADNLSDTTAPLGLLAINTPRAGSIEAGADSDVFRVDLVAGQTYTFSLQGLDSGRGTLYDPYLRLYTNTGQQLAADDDTGAGRKSLIVFKATTTGIHYLQAVAYASDQVGSYVISANGTPVRIGDANANTFGAAAHAEAFDGLGGFDTVSYAGATAGVVASLLSPTKNTGFAFGDTYTSIEGLRGSNFADTLTGNIGNNILEGGLGADKLDGGTGIDTASYANAAAGVTADLLRSSNNSGEAAGDTYKSIENLLGSGFGDTLTGNTAVNAISGGGGMDLITGGGGGDILTGGSASDMFRFLTSKDGGPTGDIITDFVSGLDVIGITRAGFKIASSVGYGTGDANDFAAHYFVSGAGGAPTAQNPSGVAATEFGHGQFLFNQATDQLWWDQDGAAAGSAVLLGTLSNGAHITADDFWLL